MRGVGKPRNMNSPEELLQYWDEYKAYIDSRPDIENVVTPKGETVKKETKKPYLRVGFEAFVFRRYKMHIRDYLSGRYEEYSQVVTCIRNEWEEDQVSGTITGKYKAPNLVARINGLVEKNQTELNQTTTIRLPDGTIKFEPESSDSNEHS